jgi:riboflavin kinase/FMN adenylyltransferase
MQLLRHLNHVPFFPTGCAVTIGNFDGVHRGHATVLAKLAAEAKKLNLPTVVVIFEPQPREVLAPEQAPVRLTSFHDKLQLLQQQPIDYVLCLRFDQALANHSAEDFIQKILVQKLNAKYILIGDDFRFGKQRKGDFHLLQKLGAELGFVATAMHTVHENNQRISSTSIREVLAAGDLSEASYMLEHPYFITGKVRRGAGRGKQWGFPTANLRVPAKGLPVSGVFTVLVSNHQLQNHPAVANVGTRPTVDGTQTVLEVLLLDFDGDLYGKRLRVEFLHKLREEQRFVSPELLIAQIQKDVVEAQKFFQCHPR